MTLQYFLLLMAFIAFVLATFGVSHPRINFGWLGCALGILTLIIPLWR